MRENGSPDPQFYNPETRSFMTVILPIHEAFKSDEPPVEVETVVKTGMKIGMDTRGTVNGTVNLPENLPENLPVELTVTAKKIYHLLKSDGKYTYDRLAALANAIANSTEIADSVEIGRGYNHNESGFLQIIQVFSGKGVLVGLTHVPNKTFFVLTKR